MNDRPVVGGGAFATVSTFLAISFAGWGMTVTSGVFSVG
jgi:hypothetical protein